MSQSYRQLLYVNGKDNTTADFNSIGANNEGSLLTATTQPVIWHPMLDFNQINRTFRLYGRGVMTTSGANTVKFTFRIGSTSIDSSFTSNGIMAISNNITTGSVTNEMFEFNLDITATALGLGNTGTSLTVDGFVKSPAGFVAPYEYGLVQNQSSKATWVAQISNAVDLFINVNITCNAGAGNTFILKHIVFEALN